MNLIAGAALALCCNGAFAATSALSSDVSAYYVNQELEIDGDSVDGDGFGLGGSLVIPAGAGGLLVPLEYNKADLEIVDGVDLEVEEIRAGVGYIGVLNPTVALYGGARYIKFDLEIDELGSDDIDGFGIFGGAKAMLGAAAKAYGEVSYVNLEDSEGGEADGPEFSLGVSADFNGPGVFAEYRLMQLEGEDGTDFDVSSFHVGARYSF